MICYILLILYRYVSLVLRIAWCYENIVHHASIRGKSRDHLRKDSVRWKSSRSGFKSNVDLFAAAESF